MLSFFHITVTLLVILLFGTNALADDHEDLDNDNFFEKYVTEWMQSLYNSNECGKDPNKPMKDERWQKDGSLLTMEFSCAKNQAEQCPDGYHHDGEICKDIDECESGSHNCSHNANCTNTDGAFNCTCVDGYIGDGGMCKDIDECKNGPHNCSHNANCTNTDGAFNCTCVDGYIGDGVMCKDIDECKNGPHNCSHNANCTNTDGAFNCTCVDGYIGDGVMCKDIDECKNGPHNCSHNANCTNTDGAFNCTCVDGYIGDGVMCKDIDECKNGPHNCSHNANCTNTDGAFNCTCVDGYIGDGVICKDIDECIEGTHNCSQYATCINTNGSYNCTCEVNKNCADVFECGGDTSGVYTVDPDGLGPFKVYCDQETSGGGWTVFQKRQDGSVDFYRGWLDYKTGFGKLTGEFWLGLDKIYRLTNQIGERLRVDLEDTTGNSVYAEYDYYAVSSENDKYRLSLGTYSGNAGDSLSYHDGHPFSTKDQDNDSYEGRCAVLRNGAWWYKSCNDCNLNGLYHNGTHSAADGVNWYSWKGKFYSAKRAEMKIRPVGLKTS